jgi:hypothetical protein
MERSYFSAFMGNSFQKKLLVLFYTNLWIKNIPNQYQLLSLDVIVIGFAKLMTCGIKSELLFNLISLDIYLRIHRVTIM